MPPIPARAHLGEHLARHRGQPEGVVEFAVGQQSSVGGDPGPVELELHTVVEIEPEGAIGCFTRRVRHEGLARSRATY
jgi:hypothetical protein